MESKKLFWLDCEMTGLDQENDVIIEVAVIITNENLQEVGPGLRYAIKTEKTILDGMGEWCTKQHNQSGLVKECLESQITLSQADEAVCKYISEYFEPSEQVILAGSSVHQDKIFLRKDMPMTFKRSHYRIVDISTIKELANRWFPNWKTRPAHRDSKHRALDDIRDSIEDLRWMRKSLFKPVNQVPKK